MNAQDRGMVLVNALVTILVIAGVSASLMLLAAQSRLRTGAGLAADQAAVYLDSLAELLPDLLDRTWRPDDPVALMQDWARPYSFPIDRGEVGGQVADLQGRFNLTWLADPQDDFMRDAFLRLWRDRGLDPDRGAQALAALVPALRGGGLAMPMQLLDLPGWDGTAWGALAPHLALLPAAARLNTNTATEPVLRAVLPGLPPAALTELLRVRAETPFVRPEELRYRAAAFLPPEALAAIPFSRFDITSRWYEAGLTATLDGVTLRRAVRLERRSAREGGTRVLGAVPVHD